MRVVKTWFSNETHHDYYAQVDARHRVRRFNHIENEVYDLMAFLRDRIPRGGKIIDDINSKITASYSSILGDVIHLVEKRDARITLLKSGKAIFRIPVDDFTLTDRDGDEHEFTDLEIKFMIPKPDRDGNSYCTYYVVGPDYGEHSSCHPHVSSGGEPCLGDARLIFHGCFSRRELIPAIDALLSILHTYNPEDPHWRLEERRRECCDCGHCGEEDSMYRCVTCDEHGDTSYLCYDCFRTCYTCGDFLCSDHRYYCDDCCEYFCADCGSGSSCVTCGAEACPSCTVNCSDCGETLCSGCANTCDECGDLMCSGCQSECADCGSDLCDSCSVVGSDERYRCQSCDDDFEDYDDIVVILEEEETEEGEDDECCRAV